MIVIVLAGYVAFFFVEGSLSEGALDDCAPIENQPAPMTTVRWEWWPPHYVCQYRRDDGTLVVERDPP